MRHEQFEHQNVANTTENERFGVQMLQNVFEMAASSSKMLQIARETDRTGDPKKDPKTEKQKKTKQFQTHIYNISPTRWYLGVSEYGISYGDVTYNIGI